MAWKIAIDAMGGDKGPGPLIQGALLAAAEFGSEIILVGDEQLVAAEMKESTGGGLPFEIRHAPQVITMEESPVAAFRKKKSASIRVAMEMVHAHEADAVISAGHTGATLLAATLILKTLPGLDRPAIATLLPTMRGHAILIDAGANVDCKPTHLYQFGIMGSGYATHVLQRERPRVGMLSIGEEDNKGNETTKEACQLLRKSSLNFVGNVEAKAVYRGFADVIVCDGFIGNIALKISESFAEMIESFLKEAFTRDRSQQAGVSAPQTLSGAVETQNGLRRIWWRPIAWGEWYLHHRPRRLVRQSHQECHRAGGAITHPSRQYPYPGGSCGQRRHSAAESSER